jgi:D-beta-D-heptose 7-phosphate kinase / D-beta-D-heptose 1-phosphate adenosyltransferase
MTGQNRGVLLRKEFVQRRSELRQAGNRVVFTNGCFDLLHRGHIELLREARQLGDILMVGVNDDASVRTLKGPGRPIVSAVDRAEMLAELRSVDYVCLFEEVSVEQLVADVLPDVLVKGGDYGRDEIVGADAVIRAGGVVRALALADGHSSTGLVNRMKAR